MEKTSPESASISLEIDESLAAHSPLAKRLQTDASLRHELQRDVVTEIAEQLIRLRTFRGLSQQDLASRMGTTQSAVARHERGRSNMGAQTLEKFLESMNAIVRIDLIPAEMEEFRTILPRWWNFAASIPTASITATFRINLPVRGPTRITPPHRASLEAPQPGNRWLYATGEYPATPVLVQKESNWKEFAWTDPHCDA